ncbi:D-inositol-3-phosphate glycosyltransferase [Jeotgalicoccus saudimassiliensis]|uniref:D-inositol-3-phosphate glycosyltransferase n=1 Tax=Jeotgalicoccus saudimassiliensis TaxID=1461582 RepID=A0A078M3A6_9STAP|nr:glycosyltransferase family 4 protein [Jeotgalicoccus saudimassiliensis]CDZ99241.1 D-inositol-3-phosphate glycosyltransferase [Jeotgalicoccus saudimassiliensis]
MKKVTMFVWNNFINDARVLREASALADSGYTVTIIAKKELTEMSLPAAEKIREGVFVNRPLKLELPDKVTGRMKSSVLTKHIPNMLLMFKMIMLGRKYETDIYHAHDLNTLIQGIASAKLRLNRKKLIYDSHEVQTSRTHYSFDKIYKIEKFLLNFTDAVIVENRTRAEYHRDLYKELPAAVHNYSELYDIEKVETFPLRTVYKIPDDKKIVLYQGGMQDGRGLFKLLKAFKEVDNAVLFMIGDGKERQNLINYHQELSLGDKVIFIERVPYKDLRRYTKAADIGIQFLENTNFNHYSASSNKLFEYIMAHVPVIGSRLPEIERVIEEESVGLTVKEGNVEELTAALQKMISDDKLRMEFKDNTKSAKEKYNWEQEKGIITDLYGRL